MTTIDFKKHYVPTLLIVFLLARVIAGFSYVVYDDAFISYRYSLNLANGLGLVYNLDETVLGTTTPLFAILLGLPAFLGADLPALTPLLNIAFDVCLCYLIIRYIFQDDPIGAVLFVTIYAISPIAARISAGGMEANLFVLMSLGSLLLYHLGRHHQGSMLAALSYFVRPEGVIMVAVQCVHRLIAERQVVRAVTMGASALALALAGMALIYLVYGHPLPQSVVAKSGASDPLGVVLKNLLFPEPVSLLLLLPAALGLVVGFGRSSLVRLLLIWGGAYLALYLLATPKVWSWYALPVQITLFVCAAMGGSCLLARLRLLGRVPMDAIAAGSAMAMVAFPTAVLIVRGPDSVVANIYQPLTEFCDQRAEDTLSIYAGDIGAVGYACYPAKILDSAGLVWPDRFTYRNDEEIIQSYDPDLLFLVAARSVAGRMLDQEMALKYRPLQRLNGSGDVSLPSPDQMPDTWRQDYVIFERF